MSLKINTTLLAGAALIGVMGSALGACGRLGYLEQPPPLYGARAKADYNAKKAAAGVQSENTAPVPAADQPDPNADNAPRTTRDMQAPEQDNVPASHEPIPGTNDMMGPPPSMSPPGQR